MNAARLTVATPVPFLIRDYLRVSKDASGRLRSPAEQHDDNVRDAASIGAVMGESYAEEGARSASRYAKRTRGDFTRLCADLASGAFGAQILQMWEPSRGSRQTGEWVALIDACAAAAVLIRITVEERTYDPRRASDRKALLHAAVDAEYESGIASTRIGRSMAANAVAGAPHGRIPYGFRREYRINGQGVREIVGQFPHPETAPVVRQIFRNICRGRSSTSIADELNERGVPTVTGGQWSAGRVGEIARSKAYGGQRVHGKESYAGQWEPLVPLEQFYAVQALMSSADRRQRPGREVHLLGYIAGCGACGGPMTTRKHLRARDEYRCIERGCTWIQADVLDQYVTGLIVARLSRPDVFASLSARPDSRELEKARGEVAELSGRLAALAPDLAADKISLDLAGATERILRPAIAAAEETVRKLEMPPLIQRFLNGESSIAAAWAAATLAARRELIRAYFEHIRLRPRDKAGAKVAMLTLAGTAPDGQPVTVRASASFPWAGIIRRDGAWEAVARGWKEGSVTGRTVLAAAEAASQEWAVIGMTCDPLVVERTDYKWRE